MSKQQPLEPSSEDERRRHFVALDETRAVFKDVPDDELKREVNRALQQAREKARAKQG